MRTTGRRPGNSERSGLPPSWQFRMLNFQLKSQLEALADRLAHPGGSPMPTPLSSWPTAHPGDEREFVPPDGARTPSKDRRVRYRPAVVPSIADADLTVGHDLHARLDRAIADLASLRAVDGVTPAAAVQLLRSESAWSSKVEHIVVGHRYVARAMADLPTRQRAAREVAANIAALEHALDLAEHPIDAADINDIHAALLPDETWSGALRTTQNWIGGSDHSPRDARYVPPAYEDVPALMDDLADYINRDDVPAIVQAAIAHAQFESIHPYPDGNGRVGRALAHYVLRRRGVIGQTLAPISLAMLVRREQYMAAIATYDRGDPRPFVALFADACSQSADAARRLAAELRDIAASWKADPAVAAARSDAVVRKIVDDLVDQPVTTADQVAAQHGVSARAARNGLEALRTAGILNRTTAARNLHVFEAIDVFAALDDLERSLGLD